MVDFKEEEKRCDYRALDAVFFGVPGGGGASVQLRGNATLIADRQGGEKEEKMISR